LAVGLGPDGAADVVDQDVDAAEMIVGRNHRSRGTHVALKIRDEPDGLRALADELLGNLMHDR
jgi:hypothetical protein